MSLKFERQDDGSWIGYSEKITKKVKLNKKPNNPLTLAENEQAENENENEQAENENEK